MKFLWTLPMFFELYRDTTPRTVQSWRWRLLDTDSSVLAVGAASYDNELACRAAIRAVANASCSTPVVTRTSHHYEHHRHRKDRRAIVRHAAGAFEQNGIPLI
ncbi:hypothetical protein RugamoR64_04350 [Duganella rhizosphaerae]|uniref:YegP family protein n=1 Tax=Duganella rhizosphaerae TaxID=2885763 RepID=UPI0030E7891F